MVGKLVSRIWATGIAETREAKTARTELVQEPFAPEQRSGHRGILV